MYSHSRPFPLWKISPGLAALVGIVAVGLHLFGVLPGSRTGPRAASQAAADGERDDAGKPPDPAEVIATRTEILRREPNNVTALVERAAAYFAQKKYENCLTDYDLALRLAPDNAEAHYGRGCLHLQKDQDDLALADFSESIRLGPDVAAPYVARGGLYGERKEYRKALADFGRAVELDPQNAEALVGRGKARRDLKDFDGALADFEEVVRLEPESPEGYNELAWTWATCPRARIRNPNLALEHAAKACKLSEWKDPLCLDSYAAAYAASGDFDKAVHWQKKALEHPDDVSKSLLDEMRARLRLYQRGQAYVQP